MPRKILIVDDDEQILLLLEKRLQIHGFDVEKALDGSEAFEKIKASHPDLIILDVVMPRMDGYSFVRTLKREDDLKDIPVIVLSGKDKMKDLFQMEGVQDYLLKPYKPEELIEKVNAVLSAKNADQPSGS